MMLERNIFGSSALQVFYLLGSAEEAYFIFKRIVGDKINLYFRYDPKDTILATRTVIFSNDLLAGKVKCSLKLNRSREVARKET